jgi:hypothetical protein
MATWKLLHVPDKQAVQYVSFLEANKFFAVDASGSTGGAPLRSEQTFVEKFHSAGTRNVNWITKWGE